MTSYGWTAIYWIAMVGVGTGLGLTAVHGGVLAALLLYPSAFFAGFAAALLRTEADR
jgi:hypothetical protein